MTKIRFETPAHKEANVNGYLLKVFESDPYYYVKVSKDGKDYDSHLLTDDESEFENLKLKYELMKDIDPRNKTRHVCVWEEGVAVFVNEFEVKETSTSYKNQLTEPCSNCISQVMCIHKDWMTILDICHPIKDYIAVLTKGNKNLNEPYGVMAHIKSIGHIFTVHATKKGDSILIGKYWSPTIKKGGYIDETKLAFEAQKYALHPVDKEE